MPTYNNTNASSKSISYKGRVFLYGTTTDAPFYVNHADLTQTSHNTRVYPMKKIHDGPIPGAAITTFPDFDRVKVKNVTGAVVTIVINEDATDQVVQMESNEIWDIDNPQMWGHVAVTGTGGGPLRIYGINDLDV